MINVVGESPPPFFKRGPAPLARLVFYLALAVMLMVADLRFHTLEWLRTGLNAFAWPLQRLAYLPLETGENIGQYLQRVSALQAENQKLHTRQLSSANLLLRQRHLEDENKQLRALLDMRSRQPVGGQVADILYAARDPFARRVIIDKGLQADIKAGQSVIDDVGVIGQVTRVFPLSAEVTLLTDKEQAIPIQVQRNGLRAVLAGSGAGAMELRFLASNADVQMGDILVTSGLDGVYLPGLPVARVSRIDRDQSFSFARIFCTPLAGVEQHGLVLVLDHREALPPRPEEPTAAREAPVKGRKR